MQKIGILVIAALSLSLMGLTAAPSYADAGTLRAQKRLNALHCDAGPADGKFGTHTRTAVLRFQSRHGLSQTGTLNTTTRARLHATTAHRCDLRPIPGSSGAGRRIVLSQRQNWLWLVDGAGRVVAQGGIVDNSGELGRGRYATGAYCGRAARVKLNRSGSVWLDNFVRFAPCGFGFHRIPRYMSNGVQMHPDWYLGTNLQQSHGCIRLSAAMAQRLWDFTAAARTGVSVV